MWPCARCGLPAKLNSDACCSWCVYEETVGSLPVIGAAAAYMLGIAFGRHGFKDRMIPKTERSRERAV